MKKRIVILLLFLAALFSASFSYAEKWDWERIDLTKKNFPKEFNWGTAVSEYQLSGASLAKHSQWKEWEEIGEVKGGPSKNAADQWNRFEDDIKLMKELGLNSFRFSVEWSVIEPQEGEFDYDALDHYKKRCSALREAGIEPMITLHHFTTPKWFAEKGGFEKTENIGYFERFSKVVFSEIGDLSRFWCTINEPAVEAMMGYFVGQFPPGKKDLELSGIVLRNLLEAHVRVYHTLKEMRHGNDVEIGLVHNYLVFEPYHSWNIIESIPAHYLTKNFNEAVMRFLKDGTFEYYIPLFADVASKNPDAKDSFDFFGLNYYSRAVITSQWSLSEPLVATCFDDEIMTDMPLAIYPEGFYEAIKESSKLGKPIYVTENGIADRKDDRRELFLHQYLYALSKAIEDGYDVRGYYYWSLIDNYEWAEGWKMKFGLYALDLKTKERTLREGAKAYKNIIEESQLS